MPATAGPPSVELTTSSQTVYVCPANARVIAEVTLTNIDGVNDATANVLWTDASASNVARALAFQVKVAKQDAVSLAAKVLEAGDTLTALASAAGDIVMTVNITFLEAV